LMTVFKHKVKRPDYCKASEGEWINYTPPSVLEFLTKIACWAWFGSTPSF
jgi:hypothetical protein